MHQDRLLKEKDVSYKTVPDGMAGAVSVSFEHFLLSLRAVVLWPVYHSG